MLKTKMCGFFEILLKNSFRYRFSKISKNPNIFVFIMYLLCVQISDAFICKRKESNIVGPSPLLVLNSLEVLHLVFAKLLRNWSFFWQCVATILRNSFYSRLRFFTIRIRNHSEKRWVKKVEFSSSFLFQPQNSFFLKKVEQKWKSGGKFSLKVIISQQISRDKKMSEKN